MGLYKYIVEQGQGFDDQAGRDTAIDKYYVTGVLDATAWVNATHTESGDPTNAKVVGSKIDESDPPITIMAGDFTISDGTNQITVTFTGSEESMEEVFDVIDTENQSSGPLNINFELFKSVNDYTGVTESWLEMTSTDEPGTSDQITIGSGTTSLNLIGLTTGTTNGTVPNMTIQDILLLGGTYQSSNGMIENPIVPKITKTIYTDSIYGVREKQVTIKQPGYTQEQMEEQGISSQIEDIVTTWQDTEFDDAVDTPIAVFQDGSGAYLYEQGRVNTAFDGTAEQSFVLTSDKATGTLDNLINIVAKQGPRGNLTINIENGGVGFKDNETAVLAGTTLTINIEDGESTVHHIAIAIQNHELIESTSLVDDDTKWTSWSLGSGTDTVTLTGGDRDFDGQYTLPFVEPGGAVGDENDATVLVYDEETLIAYADETGDFQDMDAYLDSGRTNEVVYATGVVDMSLSSSYAPNSMPDITVTGQAKTGEVTEFTYEPVDTATDDRARQAVDLQKHISLVLSDSKEFGEDLINEFIKENILMGITASGQTNAVRKALQETWQAIQTGSLHDAIYEAEQVTRTSPFLTEARLRAFINQIEAYLDMPIST